MDLVKGEIRSARHARRRGKTSIIVGRRASARRVCRRSRQNEKGYVRGFRCVRTGKRRLWIFPYDFRNSASSAATRGRRESWTVPQAMPVCGHRYPSMKTLKPCLSARSSCQRGDYFGGHIGRATVSFGESIVAVDLADRFSAKWHYHARPPRRVGPWNIPARRSWEGHHGKMAGPFKAAGAADQARGGCT